MEENDSRVKAHIRSIIECMGEKSDGHQRELLKILYLMDIDEEYEGILLIIASGSGKRSIKNHRSGSMPLK
jgi:hypothetical protein